MAEQVYMVLVVLVLVAELMVELEVVVPAAIVGLRETAVPMEAVAPVTEALIILVLAMERVVAVLFVLSGQEIHVAGLQLT